MKELLAKFCQECGGETPPPRKVTISSYVAGNPCNLCNPWFMARILLQDFRHVNWKVLYNCLNEAEKSVFDIRLQLSRYDRLFGKWLKENA